MKIVYIIYDVTREGGIERYVRELSARLAASGHDVHVITACLPKEKQKGIQFHHVPVASVLPGFVRFILFRKGVEFFLKAQEFDIIHSQGTDCLVHNVLTAHSCHKAWVEKAKGFGWWEYLKKMLHPMHRLIVRNEQENFRRYTKIIAVSDEVKREIIEYYQIPDEHIEVIHPGVDLARFNPAMKKDSKPVRNRLGLTAEDFAVLFVANEFRRKGLSVLIQALARLNGTRAKLVVVGKGFRLPYILMAKKFKVQDKIVFTGPAGSVHDYFAASDLFAMPTRHEAFGMVITEAMASGLPVIIPRYAGAAALISDEHCLLNNPSDPEEIAEKIRYFMDNKSITEKTGITMRRNVEHCTWDAMAEKVAGVYGTTRG